MVQFNLRDEVRVTLDAAKADSRKPYGLNPGNNVDLVCQKLYDLRNVAGAYVECGVFQGQTLFTVASFLRRLSSRRPLIGLDTFEGFPVSVIDERDHPGAFARLFQEGQISAEHYELARQRTKDFTDTGHLTREYFLDVQKVFEIAGEFDRVRLIKGDFRTTLVQVDEPIAVLFLDCDLYQSYVDCLEALYPQVVCGGVVVFDEYYSLKYPGARIAVNEVFADKRGVFEHFVTNEGFERWCFLKE